MAKVFSYPSRQEQFERSLKALRELFPNARESFIRGQAQSKARNVPAPKKTVTPRVKVSVAQTYRTPSRAERAEAHRSAMEWKAERRHGWPGMLPKPFANLSRNHPDFGCTPTEHAARKAGRLL